MFAVVWHFWIGVVLSAVVIITVGVLAGVYLKSVESTRYPKGR
jgi:hypothetical protein